MITVQLAKIVRLAQVIQKKIKKIKKIFLNKINHLQVFWGAETGDVQYLNNFVLAIRADSTKFQITERGTARQWPTTKCPVSDPAK